jgi:diaminopimelate decarboxylase
MPTDDEVAAAPVERKLLPRTAEVDADGHLRVGEIDLLDLAAEFGTPLFVYDEFHLRQACRAAVEAWGDGVAYAAKAFFCRAMARLAHEEGMHLDVASGGELHVALSAGVPPEKLVLHGNNKSEEELATALALGVGRIVVDSFDEIARLGRLLDTPMARPDRPRVLVRITPGVEAHTHEFVHTGGEDSKFGFSVASGAAAQAVAALELLPAVELVGLHAHIGSQVFEVSSFEQAAEVVGRFFAPLGLPELVVGGGLGVPYVNGESAPTQAEWAAATRAACARTGVDPSVRISAEPGRSIVATAGLTLYTVGTVKKLPGIRTYVSVDGGMSDNPRPVLYGSGYEAFLPRAVGATRPEVVRLVGKHCESGDLVVPRAFVPEDLRVGDVVATPVTGAYGYAMASNYNKVPRPAVVFVADGSARVVVRRETLDDMIRLDT